MKKLVEKAMVIIMAVSVMIGGTAVAFAAEGYDKVAGSDDMTSVDEVGMEGMTPIYGKDVSDGVYDITVESSSSMFKIVKAQLIVEDGQMKAVMTMGGKGYLKVFMGTGSEAAKAELSEYIDFAEDSEGNHTFTIPVEALDKPISCAAFSKNKEQWYDRSLLFEAKSLPEGAVLVELPDYEALEKAAQEKRIEAIKAENEDKESADKKESNIMIIAVPIAVVILAAAIIIYRRKK